MKVMIKTKLLFAEPENNIQADLIAESIPVQKEQQALTTLDTAPTFLVGDGIVVTRYDLTIDQGSDNIARVGGKILVASGHGDFILTRYNSDGSLDTSFSGDGRVTTDFNNNVDRVSGIAVQSDGKILVAGDSYNSNVSKFALVRYNSDGSLDTSFSGDGKVTTDLTPYADEGKSVIVQTDGKILVAGYSARIGWDFAVVRYNSDGSLDTGFSGDGKVITDFNNSADDEGLAATLQTDGKILVAGISNNDFALVRYNTDGSLDKSFSGDGRVTTDFNSGDDIGWSVAVQADGEILVAGNSNNDFALARYNSDGGLDASFSGDGKVTTDIDLYSSAITIQAGGKILVSGINSGDYVMVRYNADGSLDTGFGLDSTLNERPVYRENAMVAVVLDHSVQVYDAELAAQGNYAGASVTLARHGSANAHDVFSGKGNLSLAGGNAVISGITIGTVSNSNGILKITFNANATQERVNEALSSLAYKNTSDAPLSSVQIDWTFNDGNTGVQGTGGALKALGSSIVTIKAANDQPTGLVTISGQLTEGKTLSAGNTLADADGLNAITYIWKADATVLGTGSTYTLKATDVGKNLTVTAGYTDKGGVYQKVISEVTDVVGAVQAGTANDDFISGTDGDDILYGYAGDDVLNGGSGDDTLDGGSGNGNDRLIGGTGNDTFIVDAGGDVVTEADAAGTDVIKSSVGIILGTNVENLILTGTTAINGTGNGSANMLSGNVANNVLSVRAGNDLLIGGAGNDTLTGGTGQDVFRLNAALTANIDTITDFNVADDTVQLQNAVFTQLTATGVLNTAYFKIGPATDVNDFIIYNNTTGALFYDADGNGAGAAVQIAALGANLALTNADFVVI